MRFRKTVAVLALASSVTGFGAAEVLDHTVLRGSPPKCASFLVTSFLRDLQSIELNDPETPELSDLHLVNNNGTVNARVSGASSTWQELQTFAATDPNKTGPGTQVDVGNLDVPHTFIVTHNVAAPDDTTRIVTYTGQKC